MRSTISSRLVPSLFGPIWAAAIFIPRTSRGIATHLLRLMRAHAQAPSEGPIIEGPSVSAPASPAVFDQDVRSLPPPPADSPAAVERRGAYSPGVAAPPRRDPLLQDSTAAPRTRSQLSAPNL